VVAFAALLFAQVLPASLATLLAASPAPTSTPFSIPSPPPTLTQPVGIVDLEVGGSNSYLNTHQQRWETGYANATYTNPSGFALHFNAENDVAFGQSSATYALTTDVPTNDPHGIVHAGYVYSPGNEVFPTTAWLLGYDLRAGGGYVYEFGYFDRSYASASAANYAIGLDRWFNYQRLGYFASFSTLSNRGGIGVIQGLRWTTYLPWDAVTVSSSAGRDIEATGKDMVAQHDLFGFDAGDLHWLDEHTAIRLDTGYFSVSRAYQRFLVALALRERL
jgi:hypothetical protein